MRVAFVSLTGCEGCLYNVLNEEFAKLVTERGVEIAEWRTLGVRGESEYDVTLVEGSVTSREDIEKLVKARAKSKVLVALGTCAVLGGVHACLPSGTAVSKPVGEVVKVDYYIRGCPARPDEVIRFLERVLRGVLPAKYEARFEPVERQLLRVSDRRGFLVLDTGKCIVCGRCVELCKHVGTCVLNYVYRGIQTTISTPYGDPFDKSGCIYCGLCVAYCPVGAVTFNVDTNRVLYYLGGELRIEPEALVALAEAENTSPTAIISALEYLGFKKVVVYSSLIHAEPGKLYAKSPAEYELARRYLRGVEVELLEPKVPDNSLYITQCLAWRRVLKNAITARELQILLRSVFQDVSVSRLEKPCQVSVELQVFPEVKVVRNLLEVEAVAKHGQSDPVVFEICPGGCLMGGGQPVSREYYWQDVMERRKHILNKVFYPNSS